VLSNRGAINSNTTIGTGYTAIGNTAIGNTAIGSYVTIEFSSRNRVFTMLVGRIGKKNTRLNANRIGRGGGVG